MKGNNEIHLNHATMVEALLPDDADLVKRARQDLKKQTKRTEK
jgi:hypothetical protein